MPVVKLFASLRNAAGVKEIQVSGASVAELIEALVREKPALADLLLENGKIRPHVILTINGSIAQDENAILSEQDEIAVFPPLGGG
jgi:MoaD family protein